jgi:hypothetical protein
VELSQNEFYKVHINHPRYNNIDDALAKGGNDWSNFHICMFVLAFNFTSTNIDRIIFNVFFSDHALACISWIIFNVITFSLQVEMIKS